jgi:PAS domain S-box-containing protein
MSALAIGWRLDEVSLFLLGVALFALALYAGLQAWWWRQRHRVVFSDLRRQAAERRHAERALRQTELFYHSLVESIPQMILCKDLDGRFTFANQKFCAELGQSLEEIKGKTDFDFFPAELAQKYRRDDRAVIESGQVLDVVEEHVTPKGEKLYVQVMKTPLHGPDGKAIGIQGIFWDVTARLRDEEKLREQNILLQELARSEHQAHEDLKSAQSRMVQTEQLASLGQLVAGVAHEINNPLSFVGNNIASMERDLRDMIALLDLYRQVKLPEALTQSALHDRIDQLAARMHLAETIESLPRIIDGTRDGVRRIDRIVKELRLFARLDEGEWNEVNINPGIESSAHIVQGLARKKDVQIVLDLGVLPTICCRAARVHQVVLNLLLNAIDACSAQGTVTVRTRPATESDAVRIEVIDTGCGIAPAIRSRIFDPFFTTKPIGQGTGLGLSISYGIVQEHEGSIDVQSAPGAGTCFTVCLPRAPKRTPVGDLGAERGGGIHPAASGQTNTKDQRHETRTDQLCLGSVGPGDGLRHQEDQGDRLRLDRHLRRPPGD